MEILIENERFHISEGDKDVSSISVARSRDLQGVIQQVGEMIRAMESAGEVTVSAGRTLDWDEMIPFPRIPSGPDVAPAVSALLPLLCTAISDRPAQRRGQERKRRRNKGTAKKSKERTTDGEESRVVVVDRNVIPSAVHLRGFEFVEHLRVVGEILRRVDGGLEQVVQSVLRAELRPWLLPLKVDCRQHPVSVSMVLH